MRKRQQFVLIVLFSIILVLTVSRYLLIDHVFNENIYLNQLHDEINLLKTENRLLREKILERESLRDIASRAAELGFIPRQVRYLH